MLASDKLVPFLIASWLIIIAPGPSVLFTIARAIAWGRLVSTLSVLGNALGMLVLAVIVALGVGPLLVPGSWQFIALQWAGGLYLVWLGIDAIRHRVVHAEDMRAVTDIRPTHFVTVRQGFVVGILNPKAVVFFAVVFPQFVDSSAGSATTQLLVMGAIFAAMAVVSDGSWGLLAGTAREWLSSDPRRLQKMRAGGGLVMIGLGVATSLTSGWPL